MGPTRQKPTVDTQKVKEDSHFVATIPEVVCLLGRRNTALVPDMQLLISELIFPFCLLTKDFQKHLLPSGMAQQYDFTVPVQG